MEHKIALVGSDYVGLLLAKYFGKHLNVIGDDISKKQIAPLQKRKNLTHEISSLESSQMNIHFTDQQDLEPADFNVKRRNKSTSKI